jgi:hypothetical protein
MGECLLRDLRQSLQRCELLDREEFTSVLEGKVLAEEHRSHYNHNRPHSALGYQRPAEVGALCAAINKEDMNLTKELELTSITLIKAGTEIGVRSDFPTWFS